MVCLIQYARASGLQSRSLLVRLKTPTMLSVLIRCSEIELNSEPIESQLNLAKKLIRPSAESGDKETQEEADDQSGDRLPQITLGYFLSAIPRCLREGDVVQ